MLFSDRNESKAVGAYVQDLVSLGERWKLLVGGRYDRVKNAATDLTDDTTDASFAGQGFQPAGRSGVSAR